MTITQFAILQAAVDVVFGLCIVLHTHPITGRRK